MTIVDKIKGEKLQCNSNRAGAKNNITYNEFNKDIIQACILCLLILKIVKHLIHTDYYSILQIK